MTDAKTLTDERHNTHGDWLKQASVSQELMGVIGSHDGNLADHQKEALKMIAVKISRILSGDPNHADHWDDIAGYAYLGKGGHGQ
jgi:hypothetical protein